jgi:hypothetical protein
LKAWDQWTSLRISYTKLEAFLLAIVEQSLVGIPCYIIIDFIFQDCPAPCSSASTSCSNFWKRCMLSLTSLGRWPAYFLSTLSRFIFIRVSTQRSEHWKLKVICKLQNLIEVSWSRWKTLIQGNFECWFITSFHSLPTHLYISIPFWSANRQWLTLGKGWGTVRCGGTKVVLELKVWAGTLHMSIKNWIPA